jgi:hypothetical protein
MRLSLAQIFIGFIGLAMAICTFWLMRYPQSRRPQFREYGAFSLSASLMGAVAMLVIIALMIICQGGWEGTL